MRLPLLIACLPLSAAFAAFAAPGALLEVWEGIAGNDVALLTASPRYAGPPDQVRLLDQLSFENVGDSYGSRTSALLSPPKSGDYTFWLASDDAGELWLSTGESSARLRRIAAVSGWTARLQWDANPEQKSAPIRLEAGRRYLLRVLQKQGAGGNHAAVAWSGPGLARQVIGGRALLLPPVGKALQARIEATRRALAAKAALRHTAEQYMTRGETIPVAQAAAYTVSSEGPPPNDTGLNVLIDQGHQTQFVVLWGLRDQMRGQGFRACTSLAALDSVLTPGRPCRVRLSVDELEPFAWWPAAEFNVVVLCQQDLNAQAYTPEEQAALRAFVEGGGGLLVCGTRPPDPAAADAWGLNRFLDTLGCRYTSELAKAPSGPAAVLRLGDGWEALSRGAGGQPVRARRMLGRGRIIVAEGAQPFNPVAGDPPDVAETKRVTLRETVTWLAGGKPAAGGDARLPHLGGVGIFPEREQNLGGVVVYYAANQKPDVLACIQENIPRAARQVQAWLPTRMHAEPYTIVICGGTGGGWAIQPRPKAAAVIAYEPIGILGVFGHEMAHTLSGPGNDQGVVAGDSPHHNQGEAHAGWFQGKLQALFGDIPSKSNRDCNSILDLERQEGAQLDLAREYENEPGRAKWGYGASWSKIWFVWQKLDDRYGPTWYPRWYWIRATRWAKDPSHAETWDEMVEDMSIAVGEDLFPFFRKLGTTLGRTRLERTTFQAKTIVLPESPLDNTPGGAVCLEAIGDYRQAIKPRGK